MSGRVVFLYAALICFLFFRESFGATCASIGCHQQLKDARFVHAPLKAKRGCATCHLLNSRVPPEAHPSLQPINKLKIDELCVVCHDDDSFASPKFVHKVVQEKGCLFCHDPHSSNLKSLLRESEAPELCLACHSQTEKKMNSSAFGHSILRDTRNCMNCHDPHGSVEPHLLSAAESKVCLDCHSKAVKVGRRTVKPLRLTEQNLHRPVGEGKCSACHDPHGSQFESLLSLSYDQRFFVNFDSKSFELCFKCHNPQLALKQNVSDETGFRSGRKNLHYLHIASGKGHSCRDCHEVHQSRQPKLIRSYFSFLDVEVPLLFQTTSSGGTCTSACHGQKTYDRSRDLSTGGDP